MHNRPPSSVLQSREFHPHLAVVEDDHEVDVFAELSGLPDMQVSVRCEDGVLYISGGKVGVNEDAAGRFHSRENWAELFSHSVELGDHMDWGHADASFEDSVLIVRLPKSASASAPRIEIPVR